MPSTWAAICSRVAVESSGTVRPRAVAASAASTPIPPALLTMPSREPRVSGSRVSSRAVSARSSAPSQGMTPAWAKRAATPTAGVAAAAVCEAPARRPPSESPPTTAINGFRSAKRRAMRANLRALPNDSRYSAAAETRGSSVHAASRSLPDTSTLLPSETSEPMPRSSSRARSASTMPTPPDCVATARSPSGGRQPVKVAFSRTSEWLLITPRQLGPTRRMLRSRASAASSRWSPAPSAPSSVNPELITTALGTPASAASATAPSTWAAGTAMIARSTGSGRSAKDATAWIAAELG